jgi:hypothetical protein
MREDSVNLFLDGSNERAAILYQRMTPKDRARTIWASTAQQAIDVLRDYSERLDIVSLEHDLEGERMLHPANERSGMEVIRFLEKQDPTKYEHTRFIIHTWNERTGMKMFRRLELKGYHVMYVPFGNPR